MGREGYLQGHQLLNGLGVRRGTLLIKDINIEAAHVRESETQSTIGDSVDSHAVARIS